MELAALLLDEGALDQIVARIAHARRDGQAEFVQHGAGLVQHARAAADHCAVVLRVDRWQADIAEQLAAAHQVSETALILERLAGHGRVVDQLVKQRFAEELVLYGSSQLMPRRCIS